MKLRAITSASVSLSMGPGIPPGETVDFGDDLPISLLEEIAENEKKGLIEVVGKPSPPPAPAPEKKKTKQADL